MADFSIKAIIKAVDQFTGPVRGMIGTAQQFGKTAQNIGARLSIGLTAPITALGFMSVKTFSEIQSGMANVSTLVDTTTESMSDMTKQVLAISQRTPVAISDLTGALYDVRSAGIGAGDAMNVLSGSARLAVAGLGTTKEATDLVTSSINAFNLKGAEQGRLYDVIFKAVKNGKTTISDLAQGFGAVAGTVANAGIKLDEYLASVAALTTTGLPAAQAHTQLRAAIAGMTRQTKLSDAVLHKLGAKTFKDLIKQSGGMVPAFAKITGVVKGNDAAIIQLFGSVEAYNAVVGLTKGQNEAYTSTLNDMRRGANAVDVAFNKQSATFKNSMQIFRNQMSAVQNVIGAALAPVILKVAGYFGEFAKWFTALSPKTQNMIILFGGLAAVLGPVLVGLGLIATALAALSLPVIAIVAGIAALGVALGAAVIYWDDIKAAASGALSTIVGWAETAYKAVKPLIDAIGWVIKHSPAGLMVQAGMKVASLVSGGGNSGAAAGAPPGVAARSAAAQSGGAQSVNGQMVVRFDNAPPGMRVESTKTNSPGMSLDADVGHNMAAVQ